MSKFQFFQNSYLDAMRETADPLADAVVSELFQEGFNPMVEQSYSDFIYNHQEIPKAFPLVLKIYFQELEQPVDSASTKYILAGSRVFQQFAPDLMGMLGALSLPYCYASGKGVQVLHLSQRIRNNPAKRLLETASFVLDVCLPNSFEAEGKALRSIAKVRLMHAAIRFYTHKSGLWNPDWGVPINQEDMAGTNLAFSLIAIRGLRKLGHPVSPEQAHHFIQLWNIIGQKLGINEELLPENNREAFYLEKQISERGFYPTPEGRALTRTLIDHLVHETGAKLPVESLMHFLLGKEVASNLGVKNNGNAATISQALIIMNRLKSLKVNANAYQESVKAFKIQEKRLQNIGAGIKPYRLLKGLSD